MGVAYLFPGQGSQSVGMGKDLFARFPTYVTMANEVLGYRVDELCLKDPNKKLRETQFTQPALFVVGALSYLASKDDRTERPDFVAGHSLGEYVALFAADCFNFETGLALVDARARAMGEMSGGGMAAITQLEAPVIESLLQKASVDRVDIANYNTPTQTVISGDKQQLRELSDLVTKSGGRLHPLNVSGAFHSRFMDEPRRQFEKFAETVSFRSPQIPVVANVSALPYPNKRDGIRKLLADQIASPVRWVDSIDYLRRSGVDQFLELGSGKILTRLNEQILARPLPSEPATSTRPVLQVTKSVKKNQTTILLCPGVQTESAQAANRQYQRDSGFRETFNQCEDIVQNLCGFSIKDFLSADGGRAQLLSPVLQVDVLHAASCISALSARWTTEIDCCSYVGWGIGELVALWAAKAITLHDAIRLVAKQAQHVDNLTLASGMLTVDANPNIYYGYNKLFAGTLLAGVTAAEQFVVVGSHDGLRGLARALKAKKINTCSFAVNRGSHSSLIDPIRDQVLHLGENIEWKKPCVPVYSCALSKPVRTIDSRYFWTVCRSRYHVPNAIALAREAFPNAKVNGIGLARASSVVESKGAKC